MQTKYYFVYILTNFHNTVFYAGVTNNLKKRVFEHKNKILKGFTEKYNLNKLIYYEATTDIATAIAREKQFKNWHRDWKINLIKQENPDLKDLYDNILD